MITWFTIIACIYRYAFTSTGWSLSKEQGMLLCLACLMELVAEAFMVAAIHDELLRR